MSDNKIACAVQAHRDRHERRREATDRKIMDAALQIIIEEGVGAVTIEEVARRSGVAKTSIYRRYSNAEDLLHRLSFSVGQPLEIDDLPASRDGLRELLGRIVGSFDGQLGLKAVGIVLSSGSEYVHAIADNVIDPARERFASFVRRGIDGGQFRADIDVAFVFNTVLGSMLATQALGEPADDSAARASAWAARMTSLLWPTVGA
ncbi:TetR/AcrR family transcriptional regulator [Bifidobacterium choloepi]|uniref:TetR/AcrR family transcriptional regulator n=1 Tax=Bifidobacterium choloepi TaxID=2614131 RepID=A0A6I5NMA5_9BIFI|nr:TetR/AcrR family transcriptional regulator [Bifidobacterium choloepi]NEG69872.1 TetR/AcrR family transcriptional regulator [Bifidobacterium choloepi]